MSTEAKNWKEAESTTSPAGAGFGELSLAELREDQSAHAPLSSGWVCTLTTECGC
ncbi:hypothetical protein [Streptomyces violaceusniger]|uniref:Uncharacterized protein n=1 Tax=Streptomyces violaceusniger (strain Tu 4113) TaxID=653045 RepID=G2P7E3_STRV4|nr:hypothetical protein [Streptomyces violaceusniger]AEM87103.1 hypothetical protein Strvi_7769 [Streptomyces violaceusniger Tu 4113]